MPTPKMTRAAVVALLKSYNVDIETVKVAILGIRGYYRDSMGAPGKNDRGIRDDAFFIVTRSTFFLAVSGNTDPSKYRRGIATLVPGIYDCVKWKHKGKYAALQIVLDRVRRDGQTEIDEGRHGINFHWDWDGRGSEGCQTIHKPEWLPFQKGIYALMDSYGLKSVKYLLVENV